MDAFRTSALHGVARRVLWLALAIGASSAPLAIAQDSQAPSTPTNLTGTRVASSHIDLVWDASTDNVGVTEYRIERCQGGGCSSYTQVGTSTTTHFADPYPGSNNNQNYRYRVRAQDAANNLSNYSVTAYFPYVGYLTDSTPPSTPTGLTATAASDSQINIYWTASTDNVAVTTYVVERCQGSACSNFSDVRIQRGTSWSDTGLQPGSTYVYRVRARDAPNNVSAVSTAASATTTGGADTQAPSAPSTVVASATSSSGISLSWNASTDNVGVVGYKIERCEGSACTNFAQIGTSASTSYASGGLTASTPYRFRIRAYDAASNDSVYSDIASATTLANSDTQAPTTPTGLAGTRIPSTQIDLVWTASTDNVGVALYRIERCTGGGCSNYIELGTATGTFYSDTTATTNNYNYRYRVRAEDAVGNLSAYSTTFYFPYVGFSTDTTAPSVPGGLSASSVSASQIDLAWSASTDDVAVTSYVVERCQGQGCSVFSQIAFLKATSLSDVGLLSGTSYTYRVRARDAVNNVSAFSTPASATTTGSGADTQAPTAPSGLSATAASASQINLSWTAATDNVGVTGYLLERCQGASCSTFVQVATPTGTTHIDTGLSGGTIYRYRVRAQDAAANLGPYSATASATTQTAPDTQAPTAPTNLVVTPGTTQMSLSWTASTDNVAVTGYSIERCQGAGCSSFLPIATVSGTTYTDTGLLANVPYGYRVRATDAANNWSGYSGNGNGVMGECD